MSTFAVVTPSRGLVHSRTVEGVMAAVATAQAAGHEFRGWLLSHDLPIPDCHETVAEAGLATGAEVVVFIEEDVIVPPVAIAAMLALESPIAVVDYPVGDAPTCSVVCHWDPGHAIAWAGIGCMAIRRAVFDGLPRPWFRSDRQIVMSRPGYADSPVTERVVEKTATYGGQDVWFSRSAVLAGFPIHEVPGLIAGHARLRELGASKTNAGAHRIDVLTTIERGLP